MLREILNVLHAAWNNFLEVLTHFLPRLLAMVTIIVAGWIVATIARLVVRRAMRIGRITALADRSGVAELLRKADAPPLDRLLGTIVFWLVLLSALLSGMSALGLAGLELLAADVARFVPKLFAAILILIAGVGVTNFLWRATLVAAVNASIPSARLLGALVRVLVLVATLAMALEQLEVASQAVRTAFTLTFGAVMLAGAIAFGLGGRGLARRVLQEKLVRKDEPEEPPHV
jgi:hypothetical protein